MCVCVCVRACVRACACVCERERERACVFGVGALSDDPLALEIYF